jgi:hypothetical protein
MRLFANAFSGSEKKDLPKSRDLAAHFYPYQECQSFPEELQILTLLTPGRILSLIESSLLSSELAVGCFLLRGSSRDRERPRNLHLFDARENQAPSGTHRRQQAYQHLAYRVRVVNVPSQVCTALRGPDGE